MDNIYKITITKLVENPDYNEKDYEEWKNDRGRRSRFLGDDAEYVPQTMRKRTEIVALSCDLPEDAFNAVRKAVIEKL